MKKLSFIFFVLYLSTSLIIDEAHPFSKYPMYNSFPNYSYTFFLTDNHNQLIPLKNNFIVSAEELGHNYTSICEHYDIKNGNGIENTEELTIVGRDMLNNILQLKKMDLSCDSIRINRTHYYFNNNSIVSDDAILYTTKVE